MLESVCTAEHLGLSPADYVAVINSSMFSLDFFKAVYDPSMQEETADRLMLSEEKELGLSFGETAPGPARARERGLLTHLFRQAQVPETAPPDKADAPLT
ncbi:hypothetical protein EYZ11_008033 [Aspergillus tanneri]|uniref:Uncharacterized protein n=1 Tax=Aspergillus tanneri TaxID=1220188 RepID=A0A4S3JBW2_9EURO|nr:hypothetical protein EYZ11_008033 [Aspergillus tanneri]